MAEDEQAFKVDISAELALVKEQKQKERALARAKAVLAAVKHAEMAGIQLSSEELDYYRGLSKKKAIVAQKALSHTVKLMKDSKQTKSADRESVVDTSDVVADDEVLEFFEQDKVDTEAEVDVAPAMQIDLPVENENELAVDPDDVVFTPPPAIILETSNELDASVEEQDLEVSIESTDSAEAVDLTEKTDDQDESVVAEEQSGVEIPAENVFDKKAFDFLVDVGLYKNSLTTEDIPGLVNAIMPFTPSGKPSSSINYRLAFTLYLKGDALESIAELAGAKNKNSLAVSINNVRKRMRPVPQTQSDTQVLETENNKATPVDDSSFAVDSPYVAAVIEEEMTQFFEEKDAEASETIEDSEVSNEITPITEAPKETDDERKKKDFDRALALVQRVVTPYANGVTYQEWCTAGEKVIVTLAMESGLDKEHAEALWGYLHLDSKAEFPRATPEVRQTIQGLAVHVKELFQQKGYQDESAKKLALRVSILRLNGSQSLLTAYGELRNKYRLDKDKAQKTVVAAYSDLLQSIVKEQ